MSGAAKAAEACVIDTDTKLEILELLARAAFALDERDPPMLEGENGAIRVVTSGLYRDRVRHGGGRWVLAERRIDLDLPY